MHDASFYESPVHYPNTINRRIYLRSRIVFPFVAFSPVKAIIQSAVRCDVALGIGVQNILLDCRMIGDLYFHPVAITDRDLGNGKPKIFSRTLHLSSSAVTARKQRNRTVFPCNFASIAVGSPRLEIKRHKIRIVIRSQILRRSDEKIKIFFIFGRS